MAASNSKLVGAAAPTTALVAGSLAIDISDKKHQAIAADTKLTEIETSTQVAFQVLAYIHANLLIEDQSVDESLMLNSYQIDELIAQLLAEMNYSATAYKAALIYLRHIYPEPQPDDIITTYFMTSLFYAGKKFDTKTAVVQKDFCAVTTQEFQMQCDILSMGDAAGPWQDFNTLLDQDAPNTDQKAFAEIESLLMPFKQGEISSSVAEAQYPEAVPSVVFDAAELTRLINMKSKSYSIRILLDNHFRFPSQAQRPNMKLSLGPIGQVIPWDEKRTAPLGDPGTVLMLAIIILERTGSELTDELSFTAALILANKSWPELHFNALSYFCGYQGKNFTMEALKKDGEKYSLYKKILEREVELLKALNYTIVMNLDIYNDFVQRDHFDLKKQLSDTKTTSTALVPRDNKTAAPTVTQLMRNFLDNFPVIPGNQKDEILSVISTAKLSQRTIYAALIYEDRYRKNTVKPVYDDGTVRKVALWVAAYYYDENFPQQKGVVDAKTGDEDLVIDVDQYQAYQSQFVKSANLKGQNLDDLEKHFLDVIKKPTKKPNVFDANTFILEQEFRECEAVFKRLSVAVSVTTNSMFARLPKAVQLTAAAQSQATPSQSKGF